MPTHICSTCRAVFTKYGELLHHRALVHNEKCKYFTCDKCNRHFASSATLSNHRREAHPECRITALIKCPHCDQPYANTPNARRHIQEHEKKMMLSHTCVVCNKRFDNIAEMNDHVILCLAIAIS